MATELLTSLASNPYFSAGFGLFGVGTLATAGRALGVLGVAALRRHWVTTVEVPCNDKAYSWLLEWVAREAAKSSLHVSVRTQWEEEEGGRVSAKYLVEPSPGTHVFRWGGAWVRLERIREQQQVDVIGGVPWEVVTLTTLGRRRPLLLGMLEEARRDVIARHSGLTLTYASSGSGWRELGPPQAARPLDTVVVEEGLAERLSEDCTKFLRAGAWYRQRGVPHRRGILLHGPPGCGKTSLITALAGHLHLGISSLSLADPDMTDGALQARVADLPRNTILLLEDIDAAFISRESSSALTTGHGGLSQVTLTGLLNALDGVVASDGRLTFLTTNYPERLDPALIRPGRIDLKEKIGWATHSQISRLFLKFFPEANQNEANQFATVALSLSPTISAAQVQAHLLLYSEDIEGAIEKASTIPTL